jgi:hypothetical protein
MMVSGLVSYPLGLILESVFPFRVPVDRNPPASHAQGAIQRAGLPSRGLASKHRETVCSSDRTSPRTDTSGRTMFRAPGVLFRSSQCSNPEPLVLGHKWSNDVRSRVSGLGVSGWSCRAWPRSLPALPLPLPSPPPLPG